MGRSPRQCVSKGTTPKEESVQQALPLGGRLSAGPCLSGPLLLEQLNPPTGLAGDGAF